jgi:hypothetical protein
MNWLKEQAKKYSDLLKEGVEIFGTKEKAIKYADENSCAGIAAKKIALENF